MHTETGRLSIGLNNDSTGQVIMKIAREKMKKEEHDEHSNNHATKIKEIRRENRKTRF